MLALPHPADRWQKVLGRVDDYSRRVDLVGRNESFIPRCLDLLYSQCTVHALGINVIGVDDMGRALTR